MNIRLLASAVADLDAGRQFYESQEVGAGVYFQDCLFADIESLSLHGGIHRRVFGYHRLLSRRFPFAIYYRIQPPGAVLVYRVLDCRSSPAKIRKTLDS